MLVVPYLLLYVIYRLWFQSCTCLIINMMRKYYQSGNAEHKNVVETRYRKQK